jgi:hypothetical protein
MGHDIRIGSWVRARWFNADYPPFNSMEYELAGGQFVERSGIVTRIFRDSGTMERYVELRQENGTMDTVALEHLIELRPV